MEASDTSALFVLALAVDVHINSSRSLKAKRQVIKSILDGSRRRFQVAAAEVGRQDAWQRAELGFAVVSATYHHAVEVIDSVERFIWSYPEVDVVSMERAWLD